MHDSSAMTVRKSSWIALVSLSVIAGLIALTTVFLAEKELLPLIGLGVGVVFFLWMLIKRPLYVFVLFLFILPFHGVISILPILYIFAWKEILLTALVVVAFVRFLLKPVLKVSITDLAVVFLLLYLVIHFAFNTLQGHPIVLGLIGLRNLGQYILIYFVAKSLVRTDVERRLVLVALLVSGGIVAFLGILQVTLFPDLFPQFEAFGFLRMTSSLGVGPNNLGVYLAMIISLGIVVFFLVRGGKTRFVSVVTVIVSGGALLLSLSRTGYITAVLALGMVAFIWWKKKVVYWGAGLLFIMIIVGSIVVQSIAPISFGERVASIFTISGTAGQSQRDRLEMINRELTYVTRSIPKFLFGDGLGTAGQIPEALAKYVKSESFYTDNYYVEIMRQIGILGVILAIVALVLCMRSAWVKAKRCYSENRLHAAVLLGAFICGLIFLVGGLAAPVGVVYITSTLFWLLMGMSRGIQRC